MPRPTDCAQAHAHQKKHNLRELGDTLEYYYRKPAARYLRVHPFEGLNDSEEDARRLQRITRRVPSKINVIPFTRLISPIPTAFPPVSVLLHSRKISGIYPAFTRP